MKSDLPHNVLIVLSVASGAVMHAFCEPCKVSALGRSSHVVAVLFTLLDHVEKNGPTISTPVTSKECVWNMGKKRDKYPGLVHFSCQVKQMASDFLVHASQSALEQLLFSKML